MGGQVVEDQQMLAPFLQSISAANLPCILVHGGGKIATEMAAQLKLEQKMIQGRRITDAATLKLVTMTYAGWINKNIVAQLNALGKNAIGLSGADAALIPSVKRNPDPLDFGFVGDPQPEWVNTHLLQMLLSANFFPVIAPITADSNGQLLNTNADTVAKTVALAMSPFFEVDLIYCFEKRGVLLDAKDDQSVLSQLNVKKYQEFKQSGVVHSGMIPKLDNAFDSLENGINSVVLGHALDIAALISGTSGTKITQE